MEPRASVGSSPIHPGGPPLYTGASGDRKPRSAREVGRCLAGCIMTVDSQALTAVVEHSTRALFVPPPSGRAIARACRSGRRSTDDGSDRIRHGDERMPVVG